MRNGLLILVWLEAIAASGCNSSSSTNPTALADSAAPTASASAAPTDSSIGIPKSEAEVAKVVNPSHLPPYAGPTATVRGRVTIKGDAPPDVPFAVEPQCTSARAMYGSLFRVGAQGELADAMVAVTGYTGYVPAPSGVRSIKVGGCAFDTRTVVATFGQRIEVSNVDAATEYMPYLDGAPFRAMIVALPKGRPVQLFPLQPGHYLLRDVMPHPFEIADVFVVPYPTFDVTQVDGRYTVAGVPVGKARIDAFLPVINKSVGKDVELVEGLNDIDLELTYEKATDKPVPVPSAIWGDRQAPQPPASGPQ
jgi:hypothetical protein